MFFGLVCWVCAVFHALWCALRCWWCLFLSFVTMFVFCFCLLCSPVLCYPHLPPSLPHTPSHTCILDCRVLVLLPNPSSPPHSVLSSHTLTLHPLTDPIPPSLAGTPCRTVWRRSISQSNPESLPSGHSRDRWVTRGVDLGTRTPPLLSRFSIVKY